MRMIRLAYQNFKGSFKSYLSLILSLAFTVLVFLNFQNIIYSDSFSVLGEHNKEYVDIVVQSVSFILGCFMFFFIWYSTNVFLTKRKKEIGIYVFMGLSNQKIARLYLIEAAFTGLSALALGILFGVFTTGLFQMILLALSEIAIDIRFQFTLEPVVITAVVYLAVYLVFMLKGYFGIVRSSVINLISAAKQNEYVRQKTGVLLLKTVFGVGVLGAGYYLAIRKGGQEVINNVLIAVILVTAGVYLLFGGLLPFLFQRLSSNKRFLYRKQRAIWINSLIFRMKKNYRTYAMVCVLMVCSVTALATGFAMRYRYDNMVRFRNTYTFQLLSGRDDLAGEAESRIEKYSGIACRTEIPILGLDSSVVSAHDFYSQYAFVPYSGMKRLSEQAGLSFPYDEPGEHEAIRASHLYLMSFITERSNVELTIGGTAWRQIEETNVPYLGYLQKIMSFYIVNDRDYKDLLSYGQEMYTYNYRIEDLGAFDAVREALGELTEGEDSDTARVAIDPNNTEMDWIKVLYSLCIFMFLVFILAGGCIMFMKLYNDAFEEKERYLILKKIGTKASVLKKAVKAELFTSYAMPFLIMGISSYFSVHALENVMNTTLLSVYAVSVSTVFVIFIICYILSVSVYLKNAGITSA